MNPSCPPFRLTWHEAGDADHEPCDVFAEFCNGQWVFETRYLGEVRWFHEPPTQARVDRACVECRFDHAWIGSGVN